MVEAYTVDFNIVSSAAQTADIQSQGIQSAARGGFVTSRQANNIAEKAEKTNQKSIAQLIGIQFTLSVLLKSSQIFTNTLGALFTILGGFIDLTLAPLMPLFASVLQYLAGMFPAYNRFIQSTMSRAASGIMNIVDLLSRFLGMAAGFMGLNRGGEQGGGGGGPPTADAVLGKCCARTPHSGLRHSRKNYRGRAPSSIRRLGRGRAVRVAVVRKPAEDDRGQLGPRQPASHGTEGPVAWRRDGLIRVAAWRSRAEHRSAERVEVERALAQLKLPNVEFRPYQLRRLRDKYGYE